MGLKEMIAQSGAQNFETMRKGWLPTIDETQARSLKDLQIRSGESELAYRPTKRKLAQQKAAMDMKYQRALVKKSEFDLAQLTTNAKRTKYVQRQETFGKHLLAAKNFEDVQQTKQYLQDNRAAVVRAGDKVQDKEFDRLMSMKGSAFTKQLNKVMQGSEYLQTLTQKKFGKFTTFENMQTGKTKTLANDDPNFQKKKRDYLAQDLTVIKTPTLAQQGSRTDLGMGDTNREKTIQENTKFDQDTRVSYKNMEQLIGFVQSDDYMGGVGGDMLAGVNSIVQQGKNLFGYSSILKNGKLDESQLSLSPENMNAFRRMAINNNRTDSLTIELAYAIAKMMDRGGRVTDADFKAARDTIDAGGDRVATITLLRDVQARSLMKYNTFTQVLNQREKLALPLLSRDKVMGNDEVGAKLRNVQERIRLLRAEMDKEAALK